MVRPPTVAEVAVPATVAVLFPGFDVTVYPVRGSPPSLAGAVQVTVAWAWPALAPVIVGTPGTAAGTESSTETLAEPLLAVTRSG